MTTLHANVYLNKSLDLFLQKLDFFIYMFMKPASKWEMESFSP